MKEFLAAPARGFAFLPTALSAQPDAVGAAPPESASHFLMPHRPSEAKVFPFASIFCNLRNLDFTYDAYDIGKVTVDTLVANLTQVQRGLEWHYKPCQREQSATDRRAHAEAENEARAEKRGL